MENEENNNVTTLNAGVTTVSGTTAVNTSPSFSSTFNPFWSHTTSDLRSSYYVASTTVKRATNGYVIENGYELYIAKNEKELTKILKETLNPTLKGKKK